MRCSVRSQTEMNDGRIAVTMYRGNQACCPRHLAFDIFLGRPQDSRRISMIGFAD